MAPPRSSHYPTFRGYYTFADGSKNCIGISPGRNIWDTSSGHPWYQIPGDGKADGVVGAYNYVSRPSGDLIGKIYQVVVGSSGNFYCQTYLKGSGWQSKWGYCGNENDATNSSFQSYVSDTNTNTQQTGQATGSSTTDSDT